jgi:hypothetical protein
MFTSVRVGVLDNLRGGGTNDDSILHTKTFFTSRLYTVCQHYFFRCLCNSDKASFVCLPTVLGLLVIPNLFSPSFQSPETRFS